MSVDSEPNLAADSRKGRRRRIRVLAAALVVGVAAVVANHFLDGKGKLEQAVGAADRLEVAPTYPANAPPVLVMRGNAGIAQLVQRIELQGWRAVPPCKCLGDIEFRFYQGDRALAVVGLAHGNRLKWRHGPWGGDRVLTERSRRAVSVWLTERGCAAEPPDAGPHD
ncbi:MAG TPA: hypothetical protein P5572_12465 [Phycisphaerae bacterium]|nr:hypothetical protein [Phycisphaerae bacterium]